MGLLYALLGLPFGAFFALLSLLGTAIGVTNSQSSNAVASLPFGVGSVVFLPIFYSILHFVLGLITALLYNLVVCWSVVPSSSGRRLSVRAIHGTSRKPP